MVFENLGIPATNIEGLVLYNSHQAHKVAELVFPVCSGIGIPEEWMSESGIMQSMIIPAHLLGLSFLPGISELGP